MKDTVNRLIYLIIDRMTDRTIDKLNNRKDKRMADKKYIYE